MKISVIIPALNEGDSIDSSVSGIFNAKGAHEHVEEVIVVDGGSTDETAEIAKNHGAKVIAGSPRGRAAQMNYGARHATGDIFYFIHADTCPPARFDESIIRNIKSGTDAGCFRLRFDNPHLLLRFFGWCTRFDIPWFRFGDQSLFITRSLFRETGGFNEQHRVMEDNEMTRRLRKYGEFTILPEEVITSARKYEQAGIGKLQLLFASIVLLYELGASQKVLADWYKTALQHISQ